MYYVVDPVARQLLGLRERPLTEHGARLREAFWGLDEYGAQVAVDELHGRGFELRETQKLATGSPFRLCPVRQTGVLSEIMRGVERTQIEQAIETLNAAGHEVAIRDRTSSYALASS